MRVNAYGAELTEEVEPVVKHVGRTGITYYGVRMFLDSPQSLQQDGQEEDRSAITLWVPWSRDKGHDFDKLRRIILGLGLALEDAAQKNQVGKSRR